MNNHNEQLPSLSSGTVGWMNYRHFPIFGRLYTFTQTHFDGIEVILNHYFIMSKNIESDSMIEGSLEVKLPTMWTDGKAEVGQNTPVSKHFWKLRYPKSAHRWRKAHFEVKSVQN